MRILFVTAEATPYAGDHELARTAAALPTAMLARGHEVTLFMPRYAHIDVPGHDLRRKRFRLVVQIKGRPVQGGVLEGLTPAGVPAMFIDQPGYYERGGVLGQAGQDYPDNDERFAFFCRAVLDSCHHLGLRPDVIHAFDWPAGPLPVLLQTEFRERPELQATGSVFTFQSLAPRGLFAPEAMMTLGLPWTLFTPSSLELSGQVSFLKAGLQYADHLATVSRAWARAAQSPELGGGLAGLLKERASHLTGVWVGLPPADWNPALDPVLAASFQADAPEGKRACRAALQEACGLPAGHEAPLVAWLPGEDAEASLACLLPAVETALGLDCQLVLQTPSEPSATAIIQALHDRFPHRLGILPPGETETRRALAGSDMVLLLDARDTSGQTAMRAMRYGAVPLVLASGGLDDVVEDAAGGEGTGFKLTRLEPAELLATLGRAFAAYRDAAGWRRLTRTAMQQDFSWELPARRYESIYRQVAALRA
jgi:starch synthase